MSFDRSVFENTFNLNKNHSLHERNNFFKLEMRHFDDKFSPILMNTPPRYIKKPSIFSTFSNV